MGKRTRPTVVGHENPYRADSSFSEVWNEGYDAALAATTDGFLATIDALRTPTPDDRDREVERMVPVIVAWLDEGFESGNLDARSLAERLDAIVAGLQENER